MPGLSFFLCNILKIPHKVELTRPSDYIIPVNLKEYTCRLTLYWKQAL